MKATTIPGTLVLTMNLVEAAPLIHVAPMIPKKKPTPDESEEAVREVRRAINAYLYEGVEE